jgi:hypothetical protein
MAAPESVEGWVAPRPSKPGSARRRLVVVALLVGAALLAGYVGLTFLGAQVASTLRGTIEFGSSGTGCVAEGRAVTFAQGTDLYVVAHPLRAVSLGEAFSARLTRDGEDFGGEPARTDFSIAEGACLASTLLGESLTPAHYRLEYLAAEELIAAGEFDIAP